MTKTDRKAELIAAAKATKDDHARLVLADFLEDGGDPRGLLIRLQCLLATVPAWDPRAVQARWDVEYLLALHGDAWRAELPALDGVTWGELERGFVTSVRVPNVHTLYKHVDAIGKVGTITKVELGQLDERNASPTPEIPWLRTLRISLAHWPYSRPGDTLVSRARELELADAYYQTIELVAQRAERVPLERLALTGEHPAAMNVLEALANKAAVRTLTRLELGTQFVDFNTGYYNDPTLRENGAALLASQRFTHVELLDIAHQHVEASGLAAIVDSLPALRELVAPGNDIVELDFLPRSTGESLVRLDLSNNMLGYRGAGAIAGAKRCERLESLALDTCELHGDSITALAEAPCWHTLRELDLSRNPFGFDGALALATAPRPARLHTLRLADCDFELEATKLLPEIEWLDQLLRADLSTNALAPEVIEKLASVRDLTLNEATSEQPLAPALAHVWPHAIRLALVRVPLGDDGLPAGGAPELQYLDISECWHTLANVDRLVAGSYPRLRYLSLRGIVFEDGALAQLLVSPLVRQLDTLVLSHCNLDSTAIKILAACPRGRLRTLDLRHNSFEPVDLVELARSADLRAIPKILLTGEPYDYPAEIRDELAARFGQHWSYHADEEEPPEHPYGGEALDD